MDSSGTRDVRRKLHKLENNTSQYLDLKAHDYLHNLFSIEYTTNLLLEI